MPTGIYDADGNIRTTTVDGTTYVGRYAADGSYNVVVDDAVYLGINHPSGAFRMNSGTGETYYDSTGAVYSNRL